MKPTNTVQLTGDALIQHRTKIKTIYLAALEEAVATRPDLYSWPIAQAPDVAYRMFRALDNGTFNHDGLAFRKLAKQMGIPHTRSAIQDLWAGKVAA